MEFVQPEGMLHSHRTTVVEATDDVLTLAAPTEDGEPVLPGVGAELTLWVYDSPHAFAAPARVRHQVLGSPALIELTLPQRVEQRNQRRSFRVDVDLAAASSLGEGRLVDLSAGGCCLEVPAVADPEAVEQRPDVHVAFELPGAARVDLGGQAVRLWRAGVFHRVAVEFTRISAEHQDQIAHYVFERQRELLRQGRLRRHKAPQG
jgi:c-di-GMP-binding flagellar brake protein YcgR